MSFTVKFPVPLKLLNKKRHKNAVSRNFLLSPDKICQAWVPILVPTAILTHWLIVGQVFVRLYVQLNIA